VSSLTHRVRLATARRPRDGAQPRRRHGGMDAVPLAVADLEVAAADGVQRRAGRARGDGSCRLGGAGDRRRRGRGTQRLPADTRTARAREAGGDQPRPACQQPGAFGAVDAVRADAHPGHITPERAHRVQSAATPPGAIGASLAAAERPALSRADALQAFRIEAPGRDAVRIRHAVARVRLVRDARTGDVAELRILHRAMEALGTVCSGAAAVGDHALVVLTRVVPGTVRDAIMAAAPHHLAGRIDAERAVRATVVGSARGQVLRRKALRGSGHGVPLARPLGVADTALRHTGQPLARRRDVPAFTGGPALCRRMPARRGRLGKEPPAREQEPADPHQRDTRATVMRHDSPSSERVTFAVSPPRVRTRRARRHVKKA